MMTTPEFELGNLYSSSLWFPCLSLLLHHHFLELFNLQFHLWYPWFSHKISNTLNSGYTLLQGELQTLLLNNVTELYIKVSPMYHASPFISFEGVNFSSIYTFISWLEKHFTPFIKSRASRFFNAFLTCGCYNFFLTSFMTLYMSISSDERPLNLTDSSFVCCL